MFWTEVNICIAYSQEIQFKFALHLDENPIITVLVQVVSVNHSKLLLREAENRVRSSTACPCCYLPCSLCLPSTSSAPRWGDKFCQGDARRGNENKWLLLRAPHVILHRLPNKAWHGIFIMADAVQREHTPSLLPLLYYKFVMLCCMVCCSPREKVSEMALYSSVVAELQD